MQKHTRHLIQLIHDTVGDAPTLGCEVGVWLGQTSRELLEQFGVLTLLMVDRYVSYEEEREKKADRVLGRLGQEGMDEAMMVARRAVLDFPGRALFLVGDSVAAASVVADGSLDFAFVDANHSYESVRNDLIWYNKVRAGGLVCGHDYCARGRKAGVKRAVDEFAAENGYEVGTRPGLIWWFLK